MARMLDRIEQVVRGDAPAPPIGRLIGFKITSIKPGEAIVELEAGERHANPMGTLHGGVLCDIADAAMGLAYASTLDEDESFTTLELKINFFKPIWNGKLIAVGTIVKQGRTVGMTECRVTDEKGSLVAYSTSTCMTLRGEQSKGR
jgi:uncharacterized protein (TIGR00369 family)